MRLASLNARKKMGKEACLKQIADWAAYHELDLICIQEATTKSGTSGTVDGFVKAGGGPDLETWVKVGYQPPDIDDAFPWLQMVSIGSAQIANLHLSPSSSDARARQMEQLANKLCNFGDGPILAIGDFNTAPQADDGLYGEQHSRWVSRKERSSFNALLEKNLLVDVLSAAHSGGQQYTFERSIRGKESRFRCDLALATDYFVPDITAFYDHSVRMVPPALTDHSAIVIDWPVELQEATLLSGLIPNERRGSKPCHTAIGRKNASAVARAVVCSPLVKDMNPLVLDYGCGRGADIEFYRASGYMVSGYDPEPTFGYSEQPEGLFDLITITFVLNVIEDVRERIGVLRKAVGLLAPFGRILIATRSEKAIQSEAQKKHWPRWQDGYISSESRRTFQKGLDHQTLEMYAKRAGLMPVKHSIAVHGATICVFGKA